MPHIRLSRSRFLGAAALITGAFVACESPFEPRGEGERVPIGLVIEGRTSVDSIRTYSLAAEPKQLFVVFLEALQGGVYLDVRDSARGFVTAELVASAGGPTLEQNATNVFGAANGAVYRISVAPTTTGAAARFQFKVYAIDTMPELVQDVLSFGDTVTGETIDPMVDLDWFHAHGVADQEIVTVVEPDGPAGSGSVFLTVIDESANGFLGYVFADAGTANRLTTGRMRLIATHDYLFAFGSVTSNAYPRYRGPYRFWTYRINRAPEHRGASIPFDTEIRTERIDRAGDIDEFTFVANPGADFNAFVQSSSRAVQLEIAPPTGPAFAAAGSVTTDTSLFAHATNPFQITQAGTYIVRVSGANPYQVADTGGYRFYLYAIDRRPEHVPQSIAPGDTVTGEDIGLPGDIDEFTFSGAAGDEFEASFQALNGSAETRLQLDVLDSTGTILRWAQSVGTDTSLLRQVTGRFALPVAGTYRLRISGVPSYGPDLNGGAYRLVLYRIDRRPEALPQTLAFGDSLSGESIDVPGDVDEFHVTVSDSSGANLAIAAESPLDAGLPVQLVDSATGQVVASASTPQVGTRAASGRIRLAPGKYIVRVGSSGDIYDRSTLHGPYRLWLYRFGFGPEAVSDTFAVGDTVSGESIEPWGDEDRFHFYGRRGQHVNVAVQGLAGSSAGSFQTVISPPGGSPAPGWPNATLVSPTATAALADHQTMRLDLPATGWYGLSVSGGTIADRGAYRFVVESLPSGPEQVNAGLVPGDSVTTEPIDPLGDWDEYVVTATSGQDLEIVYDGRQGGYPYLRAFDPVTGDTLAGTAGPVLRIAGPFRVPPIGQFHVALFEPGGFYRFCYTTCDAFHFVGPYAFKVVPVNLAPESVPAPYTVGDTVRGEAIASVGDVDQFTSSATPGEQLAPFFRLTTQAVVDSALALEIVDPGTGAILWGYGAAYFGTSYGSTFSPFTVPASGSFVIRVRAYGYFEELGFGTGGYEFFVRHVP